MKKHVEKLAVAYYRVSTRRQGRSGLSLEQQQAMVRQFASEQGYKLMGEYTEVESGRNNDRPQLLGAISHARCAGATLLSSKVDRLSRSVKLTATLLDSDIPLIFVDMPSADRFQLHIRASIAEEESRMIRERVRNCLAQAKAKGVKLGSARPGHWDGREEKRLVGLAKAREVSAKVRQQQAKDRWAAILPEICRLREQGATLLEIAAYLLSKGIQPARSSVWRASTIKKLLSRAGFGNSKAQPKDDIF